MRDPSVYLTLTETLTCLGQLTYFMCIAVEIQLLSYAVGCGFMNDDDGALTYFNQICC